MDKEELNHLLRDCEYFLSCKGEISLYNFVENLRTTYLEPKEKRIEELENTNKKISDECHKLVDSFEKKQNENVELIRKVAFLENALNNAKAQIKKMICCYNCKQSQDESYCKIKKSDINDLSCWDCGCDKWEIKEECLD